MKHIYDTLGSKQRFLNYYYQHVDHSLFTARSLNLVLNYIQDLENGLIADEEIVSALDIVWLPWRLKYASELTKCSNLISQKITFKNIRQISEAFKDQSLQLKVIYGSNSISTQLHI